MRRLMLAAVLLAAMVLPAASAVAAPTGEYAKFAACPLNLTLNACVYAEEASGQFTIGKKTVPIVKPQVLQGGISFDEELRTTFYGASNGQTLPRTPQFVPGGLAGITAPSWWPSLLKNLFNETINNGFTGVTATVELAGPASSIKFSPLALLFREGTALAMPIKVKLDNPFLGSNCYIGSNSNPIQLNMTAGKTSPPPPNTPIEGDPGVGHENAAGTIVYDTGQRLVDNSFAAPGANGCGGLFSFLVDPFVNEIVGVPSAAGRNTGILEGTLYLGNPEAVKASE
jgi:hypothetical protein